MKICFVSRRHFPAISGMSTYAQNLVSKLVEKNHEVTVVAQYRQSINNHYSDGPPIANIKAVTVGVEQIGEIHGEFETDIRQLSKTIVELNSKHKFDVIHSQFAYPTGLAALNAAVDLQVPSVLSIQGGDGHWFGTCCDGHLTTYKYILNNTSAVVIGTQSFADEVNSNIGEETKMEILSGAVNSEKFVPANTQERISLKKKAGIGENVKVFLYHGRIDKRKGLIELLQAYALVNRSLKETVLVISGIGPDEKLVSDEIDNLNINDKVKVLGACDYDEAHNMYKIADIFVSPTYGEGFSNTLSEAMSCELPIVTTKAPGVQDVIENEIDGLLVEVGNVEQLAAAMKRMAEDAKFAGLMGVNARKKVLEKYNWGVVADRYLEIYRRQIEQFQPYSVNALDGENFSIDECRFRKNPHLL